MFFVCGFTLATTSQEKDRNGDYQEVVEWHIIKVLGAFTFFRFKNCQIWLFFQRKKSQNMYKII